MKRRIYASGILLLTIVLITSAALFFFGKKMEVNAASTVFVSQPYNVNFSHELDNASNKNGSIYLTDKDGKKVNAQITLQQSNLSLSVVTSTPGEYILHVEKNAFKKSTLKTKKQTIDFKVVEKIEQLTSVQDLKDYFQTVLNRENRNYSHVEYEAADTAESSGEAKSESSSHSTTNNQVEGIEEGDIVITDGKTIYSIIDNQIVITDASNPKSLKVKSKISLGSNSYPSQLMMHDDLLIVIMDQYVEMKRNGYVDGISMTKAAFYNVEDAAKPKLIREIGQDGYMNGVRQYKDVLYIVTNKTPNYWMLSEEENVELRPYMYDSAEGEKIAPMDIKQLSILPGSIEPSYTIISAIDLNNMKSKEIQTKGFLGGSSTLYMSNNALYLTAFNYSPIMDNAKSSASFVTDMAIMPVASNTDVYKFTIDGTKVEHAATTSLKGSLLNQFSMDEHNGYFRIATTEGNTWGPADQTSKNHLFIFDKQLKKVGELTDLAKGERIYSARFMGDKAYIVTFKQVDPLFVIDLANPKKPKVLGELKIPGFSNYLHPLDENHLIGFGYDTESRIDSYSKQPFVTRTGMKISLFDITDFKNPKEQDSVIIGGRGTYSDLEYNHKALFTNNEYHYFGFPVSIYEEKGEYDVKYKGSGALVYEITANKGIQLKGNLVTPAKKGELYEEWETVISRLLYIDETLYSVSRNEIKSYDLKTFKQLDSVKLK